MHTINPLTRTAKCQPCTTCLQGCLLLISEHLNACLSSFKYLYSFLFYFWDYFDIFNYEISPFPFLSSNLHRLVSFKFMVSFLFLTNCYCMHICICVYSTQYNQLNLHNATWYVFRADYLALENQLECSSLGKTTSPTPRFLQYPTVI